MSPISSIFSIAGNGLTAASNQMATTARAIVNDTVPTPAGALSDGGGLAGHMVDLVSEKTSIQANSLVLKTADKMLGSLLDILDAPSRR